MATNGLYERLAIVTGASRRIGIGAAVCRALAAHGADIFFTYWRSVDSMLPVGVDEDGPAKLQNELRELGVRCESLEIDLSQTISLSAELASYGITVNAIDPGATDSGWMTEEIRQELLPRFPMGRIGQPEDAARLIAFLASDEAAWITGQVIHATGGFR
jgi:NAD(P)-dependent dehydrogenase (short-subunit alcohol dehydrogenase family)